MWYREAGQFVTNYNQDRRIFPLRFDRWFVAIGLILLVALPTLYGTEYWLSAHMIPLCAVGLATLGLNLLTGYTGQLSLGTAGFMCIGAFSTFNLILRLPDWAINWPTAMLIAGIFAGLVGVIFGLPAIRIRGFYLLVSTLCAQYFVWWFFNQYKYFLDYTPSGVVALPPKYYDYFGLSELMGWDMQSYNNRWFVAILFVIGLTYFAKNLIRSSTGRNFMAVRDMDIAASTIGISVPKTKLLAFFVSCYYCGVAGALYSFAYIGNVDLMIYEVDRSFTIMFMMIIGGLGSITGSFLGAIFVYEFPIAFTVLGDYVFQGAGGHAGGGFDSAAVENVSNMAYGIFIIALLIREPGGFGALWGNYKQKLKTWPFPH